MIICTISMFDEVRNWNRENIINYKEVYIRVSMDVLRKRDQKGLYSGVDAGNKDVVVGVQCDAELPKNPDFVIDNDGDETPEKIALSLYKEFLM